MGAELEQHACLGQGERTVEQRLIEQRDASGIEPVEAADSRDLRAQVGSRHAADLTMASLIALLDGVK